MVILSWFSSNCSMWLCFRPSLLLGVRCISGWSWSVRYAWLILGDQNCSLTNLLCFTSIQFPVEWCLSCPACGSWVVVYHWCCVGAGVVLLSLWCNVDQVCQLQSLSRSRSSLTSYQSTWWTHHTTCPQSPLLNTLTTATFLFLHLSVCSSVRVSVPAGQHTGWARHSRCWRGQS